MADPDWNALTPVASLRRWRLVELDDPTSLTKSRLRIDERILHLLAGVPYLDVPLHGMPHVDMQGLAKAGKGARKAAGGAVNRARQGLCTASQALRGPALGHGGPGAMRRPTVAGRSRTGAPRNAPSLSAPPSRRPEQHATGEHPATHHEPAPHPAAPKPKPRPRHPAISTAGRALQRVKSAVHSGLRKVRNATRALGRKLRNSKLARALKIRDKYTRLRNKLRDHFKKRQQQRNDQRNHENSPKSKEYRLALIVARIRPRVAAILRRGVPRRIMIRILGGMRLWYRLTALDLVGGIFGYIRALLNPEKKPEEFRGLSREEILKIVLEAVDDFRKDAARKRDVEAVIASVRPVPLGSLASDVLKRDEKGELQKVGEPGLRLVHAEEGVGLPVLTTVARRMSGTHRMFSVGPDPAAPVATLISERTPGSDRAGRLKPIRFSIGQYRPVGGAQLYTQQENLVAKHGTPFTAGMHVAVAGHYEKVAAIARQLNVAPELIVQSAAVPLVSEGQLSRYGYITGPGGLVLAERRLAQPSSRPNEQPPFAARDSSIAAEKLEKHVEGRLNSGARLGAGHPDLAQPDEKRVLRVWKDRESRAGRDPRSASPEQRKAGITRVQAMPETPEKLAEGIINTLRAISLFEEMLTEKGGVAAKKQRLRNSVDQFLRQL